MKQVIQNLLQNENSSLEKFMECMEKIKEQGNVVVIKLDGERDLNQYTIFISFPNDPSKKMIRADTSTLLNGLKIVLKSYAEIID